MRHDGACRGRQGRAGGGRPGLPRGVGALLREGYRGARTPLLSLPAAVSAEAAGGEGRRAKWQRISWDEALDTVAAKFAAAKRRTGPSRCALAKGIYCRQADYVSRLGNVFGTPNVTSIDNTCYVPSAAGRLITYGFDGMPDIAGGPRVPAAVGATAPTRRCSREAQAHRRQCARDGGRQTGRHLAAAPSRQRPRPGSGHAERDRRREALRQGLRRDWTVGFDELARHVPTTRPSKLAEITWVPAEKIRRGRAPVRAQPAGLPVERQCQRRHLQQHAVRPGLRHHPVHLRQPRRTRRHLRGEGHHPPRRHGSRTSAGTCCLPSRRRRSWGPTQATSRRPALGLDRLQAGRSATRITC